MSFSGTHISLTRHEWKLPSGQNILRELRVCSPGGVSNGRVRRLECSRRFQKEMVVLAVKGMEGWAWDGTGVIQFAELMERAEADLRSSFPTKANLNR